MTSPAKHPNQALFALLAMSFIWGYSWVVVKEAFRFIDPLDFAALRTFAGALCLLALARVSGASLRPKELPLTFLVGLFSTTGSMGLSTLALATGAAGKTAILMYTMPFWTLLFAGPILGERIRATYWIAVLMALAGMIGLLEPWNLQGTLLSKILAVTAGMLWAFSTIITKIVQRRGEYNAMTFSAWQMLLGSLPLGLLAVVIPSPPISWSGYFVFALFYNVLLAGSLAVFLWYYVLQMLPAGVAGMGALATPVIGLIASSIQLDERLSFFESSGIALILSALGLIAALQIMEYRRRSGGRSEFRRSLF